MAMQVDKFRSDNMLAIPFFKSSMYNGYLWFLLREQASLFLQILTLKAEENCAVYWIARIIQGILFYQQRTSGIAQNNRILSELHDIDFDINTKEWN